MNKKLVVAWAALAASLAPGVAFACGGFFCNNQTMDQSGEEILFGVDPQAGTVRAVIRIFYQGDAEDFAWVLPVPSVPKIGVSSDEVFQVLRAMTQPVYSVNWLEPEGDCSWQQWALEDDFDSAGGGEDGGEGGEDPGGVQILDSGQVGSFTYEVVKSDSGSELFDWLNENGYVQPPSSRSLIEHYIVQNMVFVALKLEQNAGAGDITPVVLDLEEDAPCVPLVLTQIAATPDMPVRLYVASTSRSVPTNWFGVEVNEKKIDWLNYGSNYEQLVSEAADDAAGHGFVTEYAGASTIFEGAFYSEGKYDLVSLAAISDPAQWVMALQGQFQGTAALLSVLRKFVPMPASAVAAGIDEQSFYNWPDSYAEYYAEIDFDPAAATAALEERIVLPRKDAQELVDRFPYTTRMYTKVSPEEMNRDPIFAFNTGLGDVARERVATGTVICDGDQVADVYITLPDGTTDLKPEIPNWWGPPAGYEADDLSAEPGASAVTLLPTMGDAYVIEDWSLIEYIDTQLGAKTVDQIIAELTGAGEGGEGGEGSGGEGGEGGESSGEEGGSPEGGEEGTEGPNGGGEQVGTPDDAEDDGDGCSSSANGSSGWTWLLALCVLVGWRRRS